MTIEIGIMHRTEGFTTYTNKAVLCVAANKVEGLIATRISAFQRGSVLIAYTTNGVSALILNDVVLLDSTCFVICGNGRAVIHAVDMHPVT